MDIWLCAGRLSDLRKEDHSSLMPKLSSVMPSLTTGGKLPVTAPCSVLWTKHHLKMNISIIVICLLTLYTAVGTLKFQKTTGGKSIPLVINDGQEYGLSDDELLLWSCLAFQILTLHELQDAYTLRQIQKEGPKGLSFQHYLNRLSLRGLVVSGIGLTGVDALYRLLGSLTIIPLKDTFPIRLFGCVQLYLEGTIGAKEFGRYLKKKPSSPMEDTILKLADKVSLTTAELVTSMEQEKVIHNESDIMDELYTEPETTYQTLVDDVQIHHTQYPVLQAIANLYLNKQITFHTC